LNPLLNQHPYRLIPPLLAVLILSIGCAQPPPTSLLDSARTALKTAAAAGAIKQSEWEYRQSEAYLNRGWMEIARQKGRIWFLRDFGSAEVLLKRSIELSRQAKSNSENRTARLRNQANEQCEGLQEQLDGWREALNSDFVYYRAERFWNSAQIGMQTARKLYGKGEYEAAMDEVAKSHRDLTTVANLLADYENDEAGKLATWRKWVEETIEDSRQDGSTALVVDKAAHAVYLYKVGKQIKTYRCDLGYNSAHQKMFDGDGATPEGKYHITKVKDGNSKYYRALLLNYPNDADQKRFKENKRRGAISSRAGVGRLIEIHGEGGQGKDWTDGCVVLSNDDMDNIMKYIGVGTAVTIVRRYNGHK